MRVLCATCNKPVDKLSWWVDNEDKAMRLKAECHGAVDTSEIDLRGLTLKQIREIEDGEGVAFMPPIKLIERR